VKSGLHQYIGIGNNFLCSYSEIM